MANGSMTAVTIKSDKARLTTKACPASLPLVVARCRRPRRCLMVTPVMTARLPRVPTTAATTSTPTYDAATAGFRLNNDPPSPAAASELFVSVNAFSGNSIVFESATFHLRPTMSLLGLSKKLTHCRTVKDVLMRETEKLFS